MAMLLNLFSCVIKTPKSISMLSEANALILNSIEKLDAFLVL